MRSRVMRRKEKSILLSLSALILMFTPVTASAGMLGDPNATVREQLETWDGAQAFLALTEVAAQRCPRFERLLDREREELVVLVPPNAAIADWLRIAPETFDGLSTEEIVDKWQEVTAGRDVEPRDLCRLLRRHFSRSEAQTVQELLNRGFITTVNGEEIPVAIGKGGVTFDDQAPITVRDVATLNGVIHFLGQSLAQDSPPPSSNVVRVYTTASGINTNLGGLVGADAACQRNADTVGLGGTWTAWLSDSETDAVDRIPDGRYELPDGTLIAEDIADLTDGRLKAPINQDEDGTILTGQTLTGTNGDGTRESDNPEDYCGDWTTPADPSAQNLARTGYSSKYLTEQWTNTTDNSCSETQYQIYCFGITP